MTLTKLRPFFTLTFALGLSLTLAGCGDLDDDIECDPELDGPDCVCEDPEDLLTCAFIDEDDADLQANIEIIDFGFSPQNVTIKAGGTVTWTNKEATQHSVTCDTCTFDEVLDENDTFNQAGTFTYIDRLNDGPKLTGTITVE